jgi:hypothetical protein
MKKRKHRPAAKQQRKKRGSKMGDLPSVVLPDFDSAEWKDTFAKLNKELAAMPPLDLNDILHRLFARY